MKRIICLLLSALALTCVEPVKAEGVKVGEAGGWNVNVTVKIEDLKGFFSDCGKYASAAWRKVFTRHRELQQIFTINGKSVVAVPVRSDAGGTRLTHNINFDPAWTKNVLVRVLVANVPAGRKPVDMLFQQKYDEDWGGDPNIGPVMKHGDVLVFNPGHGRYMASRSGIKYWGSVILFADARLTPAELQQLPGHIKLSGLK